MSDTKFTSPHSFPEKQTVADDDEFYGMSAPYEANSEYRSTHFNYVTNYLQPKLDLVYAAIAHGHQLSDVVGLGTLASKNTITSIDVETASIGLDRLENAAPGVILGRSVNSGSGSPVALTAAEVLAILNVEAGAQVNRDGPETVDLLNSVLGGTDWQTGGGGGGSGAIQSVFGRTGTIIPLTGDYNADQIESSGTVNQFTTQADINKLTGIAPGATANSPDATLLDRANHTGAQAASSISDFDAAVQAAVNAYLEAGDNITLVPNAGRLRINATAAPPAQPAAQINNNPASQAEMSSFLLQSGMGPTPQSGF